MKTCSVLFQERGRKMSEVARSSLPLLGYFARNYPRQSVTVILSLLLAAFAETVGIGAMLPLISIVIGKDFSMEQKDGAIQAFVDRAFQTAGMQPTLETLLILIVGTILLKSGIVFLSMRYTGYVAANIAQQFQMSLINALMRAQWQYFSGLSIGTISNAIASEAQRAGHSYMLAGRAISSFIQAIIYISAAFLVSWELSALAIALGIVLAVSVKGLMHSVRKTGHDLSKTMDELLSQLNQSIGGAKPLKAMALEQKFCNQLEKVTLAVDSARKKQYSAGLFLQIVYEPTIIICLAIGLYYVLTFTQTPVPKVILLAFLFQRLMGYVNLAQSHFQNMIQNESAVWSMQRQISEAHAMQEQSIGQKSPELKDGIQLEDVVIAYANGKEVFNGFNCWIPYKKLTVLFGASGIGKTTLTDAILGLIPLSRGKIMIDGQNLTEIDTIQWRSMVGYVPQDNFLFHDTIYWNVTLGDAKYSERDVTLALERASALGFVMEMPQKFFTVVGERGGKLSGGQRQRIILARALIRNPRLLILDEPTSALDKENEKVIFDVLKNLSESMAIILISHNEDVLKIADNVVELK